MISPTNRRCAFLWDQLNHYLRDGETKKVDVVIIELRQLLDDKPYDYDAGGFTAGFFRNSISGLGVDEKTTFAMALTRSPDEKFTEYIRSLSEGMRADKYELESYFQVSEDETDQVFSRVLRKMKKLGWKFSMQEYGRMAWVVEKP